MFETLNVFVFELKESAKTRRQNPSTSLRTAFFVLMAISCKYGSVLSGLVCYCSNTVGGTDELIEEMYRWKARTIAWATPAIYSELESFSKSSTLER